LTKEEEARRRGMLNIADNVPHGSRSNSSAGSSCGFVTTTKTASLSVSSRGDEIYPGVAEVVFPNSESEHGGHAPASASESPEDPEAMIRSNKRRHVLWELLTTEDNFISDMQFLIHVGIKNVLARRNAPTLISLDVQNHSLHAPKQSSQLPHLCHPQSGRDFGTAQRDLGRASARGTAGSLQPQRCD
jgi:hypothetical protein